MENNIMSFINALEGYKTSIKNCHWSAKNMSEHKLCDDIASSVAAAQDEVSEIAQGLHGQISPKELSPKEYKFDGTKPLISDIISTTNEFYETIDGKEYIGMRSVVENFLGELNKFEYLINLCLKESIIKKLNKKNMVKLTESEVRSLIRESIKNVKKTNKRQLHEGVYLGDIDTSDARVNLDSINEDGFGEFTVTCDNGWYTFVGTYGTTVELDYVIVGHSGHGRQEVADDEITAWFEENLASEVEMAIQEEGNQDDYFTYEAKKSSKKLTESETWGHGEDAVRTHDDEFDSDYDELSNTKDYAKKRNKFAGDQEHKNYYKHNPNGAVSRGYFDYDHNTKKNVQKENKKVLVRMTEQDLHNIIKESVKHIVNELSYPFAK